jgi:hypothetical protein
MAGKAPRPNKNSNGQTKQPAVNPTGGPAAVPPAQGPPSLVPPGGPPSMDEIAQAKAMQQQARMAMAQQQQQQQGDQAASAQQHAQAMQQLQLKGQQALAQGQQAQQTPPGEPGPAQAPVAAPQAPPPPDAGPPGGAPGGAPPQAAGPQGPGVSAPPQAPPGAQQGINPSQWQNNQVREGINFKDLPPLGQAQAQEQEGINPAAPLQMIQSQLQSSLADPGGPQGGPQQGPVPASFSGPMVPPGTEGLPSDLVALTQTMQRGMAPGSSNAEHQTALNAHAMAKATVQATQNHAANMAKQTSIHQALGGLMQHLTAAGQLPHPADVSATMQRHPALNSSY